MAYPLDKIILKGEWDYLVDILELLQDGAELAPNRYINFICNRLHRLESIKDEVEKKRLGCVFSYINHLVKYKEKDKRRLADEKRDLLISYVLVLTLIADGFRTEVSDIY